ncbi:NAD(P)-dependent oxidoreductase [Mucilaginibacter sp. RS28]|uniref:NAD(P)-dependent oxidoreductase n=1 Tax=Mucilaginibacter straminoryzae TaxID=2932774 RepID=A0A9X1X5K8_9SPHI|nr:NAD(P)-dependent oxidoreductase [Mucilaginibacter straminoryzae]MCJ8211512.1 NAD(P)-dependent oxidoreductase [Mucilaginibacter straminoryzae]
MRERVLITGASGFVGNHLIEEALKNDLDVYIAVRKSSKVDHLKHFDIQLTYPKFNNTEALAEEIEANKYQYIIHAAGLTKAKTQAEYNQVNAGYTLNLAKAAALRVKKFVLVSSLAAAGPLKTTNGLITESMEPKPVTAYGRSKLLAEQKLAQVPNLNYTILRPTAVYGPREKDIFIVIKQIAKGLEPYIGQQPQKLSFIYVKDLATATIKALYGGDYHTYHLSDGNFYDRYELGTLVKDILGIKAKKIHLPVSFVKILAVLNEKIASLSNKAPALNLEKLNELTAPNWACSIEAAEQELGFYPQYNLERGLEETLKWYKDHNWL